MSGSGGFARLYATTALAGVLAVCGPAYAHEPAKPGAALGSEVGPLAGQSGAAGAAFAEGEAVLWEGLGTLTWPVTTTSPEAQAFFDQGLRLAYAFNHAEARRSFRSAQKADPACAMCWWGEALVLGPNINWPMEPAAIAPAAAAVARAMELAAGAGEKERALIQALATRYSADPSADRLGLDRAYAEAMRGVAARFPDDGDIAVLAAEAMMDTQPWNYWAPGGHEPIGYGGQIVAVLERVLAASPDHPGAIHLYIHAVEASDSPERAEPYADRLAAPLMPAAGHLVHMPAHIYYRVGRYRESLELNLAATAADEAYFRQVPEATGIYRDGYYPHNIHFILVSAQMAGDAATAIEAAEKLAGTVTAEAAAAIPWVQPVMAAPYFAHAQFSDPATILALPWPGEDLPYVRAMWHYARGLAHIARGDAAAARAEAGAIATIDAAADFQFLTAGGVPADAVLAIARRIVEARIAQAEGRPEDAIGLLAEAVFLQDGLAYNEPPYWYYPVRQTLGAAQMMAGDLDGAQATFLRSLEEAPQNGWALFGLVQVLRAKGEMGPADEATTRLYRAWMGDPQLLTMARL